jgi:ribosomal protein S18 acetylase RimI-like enzyme
MLDPSLHGICAYVSDQRSSLYNLDEPAETELGGLMHPRNSSIAESTDLPIKLHDEFSNSLHYGMQYQQAPFTSSGQRSVTNETGSSAYSHSSDSFRSSDSICSQTERLIGIATGTDSGYIMTFGIHSNFRRQGLGSQLIRTFMSYFECNYIYLDVHIENEAALRFYRKLGFVFERVLLNYYVIKGQGENAWRLSIRAKGKSN